MKPKLVRDNVPSIIKQDGKKAIVTLANQKQIIDLLKDKLVEEAIEARETYSKKFLVEELADVLQVIKSLCERLNIDFTKVEAKMHKKAEKKGVFNKGYILKNIL